MGTRFDFIEPFSEQDRQYARNVVEVMAPILESLAAAFPVDTEVLLQDLTSVPNSIAAIANPVTGRSIGGPPTNAILYALKHNLTADNIGYRSETSSGSPLRSSAIYFRGPSGRQVVCLCVNSRIEELETVAKILGELSGSSPAPTTPHDDQHQVDEVEERFPANLASLTEGILQEEVLMSSIPVDLMRKEHRIDVVRRLDERGYFTLRGSVDLVADELKVSRYTVYNYLDELRPAADSSS